MALGTPLGQAPRLLGGVVPGSQFQQAFQFGQANFGNLQSAQLAQQRQSLLARQAALQQSYGSRAAGLQEQYQNALAQSGIQGNILNIQRGDIPGQLQRLAEIGNIQRGQLTSGLGTIDQLRDVNLAMKALAQQGFRTQVEGLNLGREQTQTRSQEEERRFTSESIGRGAVGASGTRAGLEFIGTELEQQLESFDIRQKQARQDLEQTFLGLKKERIGLAQQRKTLLSDFQLQQLNNKEREAALRSRDRILGEQARLLGLQKEELAINLSRGLESLNLDRTVSVGQIMDALNSNSAQAVSIGRQLAEFALQNAGAFPGQQMLSQGGGGQARGSTPGRFAI